MRKRQFMLVSVVLPAVVAVATPAVAEELTPEMREPISRTDLGRQEVEQKGDQLVREANRLLSESKYFEARDQYIKAIGEFEKFPTPYFEEKVKYCRQQIVQCYLSRAEAAMANADELARSSNYDEAIKICKEAVEYAPELKSKLDSKIALYEQRRDAAATRESYAPQRLMPSLNSQEYQIQMLLEQGRRLAAAGELGAALRKFQEILLINPYHADAMQNIKAVNYRIGRIGLDRFANTVRRNISEVEWKYSIPIIPEADNNAARSILDDVPRAKRVDKSDRVRKKLESIIIPLIDLDMVSVDAAIRYLREQSRIRDPEGVGVDIFRLVPAAPLVTATPQPNGEDGVAPEDEIGLSRNRPAQNLRNARDGQNAPVDNIEDKMISLEIRNKPLITAVRELCRLAKLNFHVDGHGVVITAPDVADPDSLELRIFSFNTDEKGEEELKARFAPYGVDFPTGSKIFYDNSINRLVVINTPENLRNIEAGIADMEAPEEMIQIMVKVVEIEQTDLNELAFNWQLSVNANKLAPTGPSSSEAAVMRPNSNELMRYYRPSEMAEDGTEASPLADSTLSYVWANSDGTKIIANMFALDWIDSRDVLTAPRVTTLANQPAKVEMITKRYFPSSFELIDIEQTEGDYNGWVMTGADPQPQLDMEKDLGISFEITPTVKIDSSDPNGEARVIQAKVSFPIISFYDWMIFDARTVDSSGDTDGEYYQMPIFDERRIDSFVELYDGQTIVIGGVAQDKTTTVNDKIPILGDLPLIGRLFQSKYTDSVKTNLLFFLTCRLVKPDGSARYPDIDRPRGLPNFSRNQ